MNEPHDLGGRAGPRPADPGIRAKVHIGPKSAALGSDNLQAAALPASQDVCIWLYRDTYGYTWLYIWTYIFPLTSFS